MNIYPNPLSIFLLDYRNVFFKFGLLIGKMIISEKCEMWLPFTSFFLKFILGKKIYLSDFNDYD
jgi:hypothetical protein